MKSCKNCGARGVIAKQLCSACYQHQRLYGQPRPQALIELHGQRAERVRGWQQLAGVEKR